MAVPNYHSLVDLMAQESQETSPTCQKYNRYIGLYIVLVVVGGGLSVAQIAVGFTYLNDCPSQLMIPVFLIVGGIGSLLFSFACRPTKLSKWETIFFWDDCREAILPVLFGIFFVCWLLTGSVFIVTVSNEIDNCVSMVTTLPTTAPDRNLTNTVSQNTTTSCPYCQRTVLKFAYAVMVIDWIVAAFVVLLYLMWGCLILVLSSYDSEED